MSTLKELFDAEQKKISDAREKSEREKGVYFNDTVMPVISRVLSEINKDADLSATYEIQGGYDWNGPAKVDVIVGDKGGQELGRATMTLESATPGLATVMTRGQGEQTYTLSADAIEEQHNRNEGDSDRHTRAMKATGVERLVRWNAVAAAKALVTLAAQNAMDKPKHQAAPKSSGGALRV